MGGLKRRNINFGMLGLLSGIFPSARLGAFHHDFKFNLTQAHLKAADQAKVLARDRPIKLSLLYPNGCLGNIEPVAAWFSKLSGIQFEFIQVPVDEVNTRMLLSNAANKVDFDIALPATFGIPDLVEAKVLAKLDSYVKRYEPESFNENALYSVGDRYRGSFYGYQADGDTYLMFYNRSLLEDSMEDKRFSNQTGYHLKVPETWEELDQMLAFFHRPEQGMYGGALFRQREYIAWEWWVRFHAKGSLPLADDLTPQINNEQGVQALEEFIKASKYLYPEARTNGLLGK